jgi:hypothetical protein
MRISMMRLAVAALLALGIAIMPEASQAASGRVALRIVKASFVVGVQGGEGVLRLGRRSYPLTVGGVSIGFSAGGSEARLVGTVTNVRSAADVAGVYSAATAGGAIITGTKQVVTLTNEKGAVMTLRGQQVGLEFNLDLGGMAIGLR